MRSSMSASRGSEGCDSGGGYSVLEVIKSFEKMSGVHLNYEFAPRRRGDVEKIWSSPAKAEELLNWKAYRSLDDMTETAWKWQLAVLSA